MGPRFKRACRQQYSWTLGRSVVGTRHWSSASPSSCYATRQLRGRTRTYFPGHEPRKDVSRYQPSCRRIMHHGQVKSIQTLWSRSRGRAGCICSVHGGRQYHWWSIVAPRTSTSHERRYSVPNVGRYLTHGILPAKSTMGSSSQIHCHGCYIDGALHWINRVRAHGSNWRSYPFRFTRRSFLRIALVTLVHQWLLYIQDFGFLRIVF